MLPTALVSVDRLRRNARLLPPARGESSRPGPLPLDAWGHGAEVVGDVLAASGSDARGESAQRTLLGLGPASDGALPVMRLTSHVISTKRLCAGEGVSYGYAYRAPVDTRIALVAGGYAQGIARSLGGVAEVLIDGDRHRIVGRVAMDVCVVEIGDALIGRGSEVVFFGDPGQGEPGIADWAEITGLEPAELTCLVGTRARRVHA